MTNVLYFIRCALILNKFYYFYMIIKVVSRHDIRILKCAIETNLIRLSYSAVQAATFTSKSFKPDVHK